MPAKLCFVAERGCLPLLPRGAGSTEKTAAWGPPAKGPTLGCKALPPDALAGAALPGAAQASGEKGHTAQARDLLWDLQGLSMSQRQLHGRGRRADGCPSASLQ